jgi:hypothetical protein
MGKIMITVLFCGCENLDEYCFFILMVSRSIERKNYVSHYDSRNFYSYCVFHKTKKKGFFFFY